MNPFDALNTLDDVNGLDAVNTLIRCSERSDKNFHIFYAVSFQNHESQERND